MYCPSFCLRPVDPVSLTDSLPARSTRDRDDTRTGPPPPAVEREVAERAETTESPSSNPPPPPPLLFPP